MTKFVGDGKVILNLQGIRFIQKVDRVGIAWEEHYFLEWEYKGSKGSASYKEKADRDAMYECVRLALCPAQEGK